MVGIVTSLAACSSTPYYGAASVGNNYSTPNSLIGLAYNFGKHTAYTVPKEDRQRHERCVFFALDNLQAGEQCNWHSNSSSAKGEVLVAGVKTNGCHTIFNTIYYKGKSKGWQDMACPTNGTWKFYQN